MISYRGLGSGGGSVLWRHCVGMVQEVSNLYQFPSLLLGCPRMGVWNAISWRFYASLVRCGQWESNLFSKLP